MEDVNKKSFKSDNFVTGGKVIIFNELAKIFECP